MGSEIKNPRRDLPRAAIAAGALTLGIYVSVTWALQQLLPPGDIGVIEGIIQGVDLGAHRGMGEAQLLRGLGDPALAHDQPEAVVGDEMGGDGMSGIADHHRLETGLQETRTPEISGW